MILYSTIEKVIFRLHLKSEEMKVNKKAILIGSAIGYAVILIIAYAIGTTSESLIKTAAILGASYLFIIFTLLFAHKKDEKIEDEK